MTQDLSRDVELVSLRRRVESMEVLVFGGVRRGPEPEQVVSLFVEATRVLATGRLPREAAVGWAHAISTLDEPRLLELARQLDDPAPWRVFLRLLVLLRETGFDEDVAAAEAQLRIVVRNLLDAAGLGLVQPDDLLRTELPIERMGGA